MLLAVVPYYCFGWVSAYLNLGAVLSVFLYPRIQLHAVFKILMGSKYRMSVGYELRRPGRLQCDVEVFPSADQQATIIATNYDESSETTTRAHLCFSEEPWALSH